MRSQNLGATHTETVERGWNIMLIIIFNLRVIDSCQVLLMIFGSVCSFICLQAVFHLSGHVCKSTWRYTLFIFIFISCFVIDFLST